eukprot:366160-Chlamydomonas_euryale.AAC.7
MRADGWEAGCRKEEWVEGDEKVMRGACKRSGRQCSAWGRLLRRGYVFCFGARTAPRLRVRSKLLTGAVGTVPLPSLTHIYSHDPRDRGPTAPPCTFAPPAPAAPPCLPPHGRAAAGARPSCLNIHTATPTHTSSRNPTAPSRAAAPPAPAGPPCQPPYGRAAAEARRRSSSPPPRPPSRHVEACADGTASHCTASHCTAPHCTASHCTA